MTSQMMTLLGACAAMMAFLQAGLPAETPLYVKIGIGALNAFVSTYLGLTNRGTSPIPEQKIQVTMTEPPFPPPGPRTDVRSSS